MKRLYWLFGIFFFTLGACGTIQNNTNAIARKEVAPTGKLRLAGAPAPIASAVLIGKDPKTGQYAGVPVDIAADIARQLDVPLVVIAMTGREMLDSAQHGTWDIAFMPVDAAREQYIAYGPVYVIVESTYLVPPSSKITVMSEIDQLGVRVVARTNSPQMRHLSKSLKNGTLIGVENAHDQLEYLRSGKADAMTAGNAYLMIQANEWSGARVLAGGYSTERVAIVVPKNRPTALEHVTEMLENARSSGVIRRAFDRLGLKDLPVPSSSRTR